MARQVVAARDVKEFLSRHEHVYDTTIRMSTKITECYGHHQTIFDYAPKESAADDYTRLAEEIHGASIIAR
jgi:cellulose biosynthesis protein BcsQ